ncbi:MAG: hypothetical protein HC835_01810 [Oscillatoriales cyanobacterium RM2_1_1]|nr:hypothetical protein [Oscillatoriales cyanobacterium SM2_3_0]NJO44461.1 hypothetical protein [Oscillatoriales cyanobacterium RM2_1_1]
MPKPKELTHSCIQEPIRTAPAEVREIIEKVLKLEKDRQYQQKLRGVNEDILKIIKQAVQ